jgi:hypothetical protein
LGSKIVGCHFWQKLMAWGEIEQGKKKQTPPIAPYKGKTRPIMSAC